MLCVMLGCHQLGSYPVDVTIQTATVYDGGAACGWSDSLLDDAWLVGEGRET